MSDIAEGTPSAQLLSTNARERTHLKDPTPIRPKGHRQTPALTDDIRVDWKRWLTQENKPTSPR